MIDFLTFKSGKFYFTEQFDFNQIEPLLIKAAILNETIVDLPILPSMAARIEPELMYSSIAGTAAIEGNPITQDDVRKIAEGEDVPLYTQKAKQEIKNLINAYDLLFKIVSTSKHLILTEDIIKEVHKLTTHNIIYLDNNPGQYRNHKVQVGDIAHGGIYTPPKIIEDIKNLMKVFVEWINSDEILNMNPFIRAAMIHYYFCIIHPFGDGNGRTARLLETMILHSENIKYVPRELSNYYYKNVDDYYIAFSKTLKNQKDITPFLKFCLTASVESLFKIKSNIILFIRQFALRDFYRFEKNNKYITQRQFELINLLLDSTLATPTLSLNNLKEIRPFSILYNKISNQTIRRDLKKLIERNILIKNPNNEYILNYKVLG